jgi:hypothetical protein
MTAQIIPVDPDNARTLARHATEIRRLGKQVVSDVIEIGRLLVESKELVGHGDWLPWLSREFQWSDATAERFMWVHRLSLKNGNLPNLDIPLSGLYLLAAPSTPETAKLEAISRAEAGEPMTVNAVKEIVRHARQDDRTNAEPADTERPRGGFPWASATEEERWQRSLANMAYEAGGAASLRASWTKEFGEWERFTVPSYLVPLVEDASREWACIECLLRKGTAPTDHLVIRLGPEQILAVDEWRRHYVEDLPPLAEAIVRLMEIGLKEETGRGAEDKPVAGREGKPRAKK